MKILWKYSQTPLFQKAQSNFQKKGIHKIEVGFKAVPFLNIISISCYKVISSQRMRGGKDSPHYALSGVSPEPHALWGQPTTFLGWYAEEEDLKKEIRQIENALAAHLASYQLQYSVKTQAHWLSRKIVRE